jgi:acyl-CoA synthetase (NDP forming)
MGDGMDRLFFPRSVCVIGASRDPIAYGHIILKNLINGCFAGEIYPVNPHAVQILSLKCYASVREILNPIDLAIIAVPAPVVPVVMEECVEKKIPYAIVISAGFRETGEAGKALEAKVLRIAKEGGIRIMGPNCMGIYNSANNLTATFTSLVPKQGEISFISQSGAIGITMLAWAKKEGIGFGKFMSVGNEIDLSIADFLDYLKGDKSTKVVTVYMESVKDGRALIESFRSASSSKPIIVMKVGGTQAGARAASSHTGALAVEDLVMDGIFRQFSIMRVKDTEKLFELAVSFATLPIPAGRTAAVVTSGGGWAVECSDLMETNGLQMPHLPASVREFMDSLLPSFWSKKNPIDMVASSDAEIYFRTVEALLRLKDYDMVFLIGYGVLGSIAVPSLGAKDAEYALRIASLVTELKKPIYVVDVLGPEESESARAFERAGLPVFSTVRSAVETAVDMVKYGEYLRRIGAHLQV